jgi:uncharacterized membrane protein (DUF485 family)
LTSVTERIPLDRIEQRARHARPGRAVLVVIASLLFALGWVTCKAFAVAWLALAWCGSAVAEGWISARAGQEAP